LRERNSVIIVHYSDVSDFFWILLRAKFKVLFLQKIKSLQKFQLINLDTIKNPSKSEPPPEASTKCGGSDKPYKKGFIKSKVYRSPMLKKTKTSVLILFNNIFLSLKKDPMMIFRILWIFLFFGEMEFWLWFSGVLGGGFFRIFG
jgi:hypothetical protein